MIGGLAISPLGGPNGPRHSDGLGKVHNPRRRRAQFKMVKP
jgi:hypothetical protein